MVYVGLSNLLSTIEFEKILLLFLHNADKENMVGNAGHISASRAMAEMGTEPSPTPRSELTLSSMASQWLAIERADQKKRSLHYV